jgi:ABC-2 type transport system permease protein
MRRRFTWIFSLGVCAFVIACGDRGVTKSRVEIDVARTFANLVRVQTRVLVGVTIDASTLRATAACKKVTPEGDVRGAGDWRCAISWYVPGRDVPVQDSFDVAVAPDGCYTATADAEAHVGGPTLKTREGRRVTNVVYAFDGCFDPTRD